jgi:hypothetical protein
LLDIERLTALRLLSTPVVLERLRAAVDGTVVLMKGYEVALAYEDPVLRPFIDLDILVEDSKTVQRSLVSAGFTEVLDPELFKDIHHERPLWLPGFPVKIEIHHAPKWPDELPRPTTEELLAAAVPSKSGIDGISSLPPAEHALVLAAHSWAHLPLRRLRELIDVAAVLQRADRAHADTLAGRWGIDRIWHTTSAVADSLFSGGRKTSAQMIWARHLLETRERTVFESHLRKWTSPFWALPWYRAVPASASEIVSEFIPGKDEGWRDKAARARRALSNRSLPRSEHESQLGPGAHRHRRRR